MSTQPDRPTTLTVYADFTDPWSALASTRLDALAASGMTVHWRAVSREGGVRFRSKPLDQDHLDEIAAATQWQHDHACVGEAPVELRPSSCASATASISAFGAAVESGIAGYIRHLLIESYWRDGLDIGNPEVLRTLLAGPFRHGHSRSAILRDHGYAVSPAGGPITHLAWELGKSWHDTWTGAGSPELPAVFEDSDPLNLTTGRDAVQRLGDLIDGGAVAFPAADPFTLPPLTIASMRHSIEHPPYVHSTWYER